MHRTTRSILVTALLLTTLLATTPAAADAPSTFHVGNPLTLDHLTPLATLAQDPNRYEGRQVLVEGEVTSVCQRRGCWMELADDTGHGLRVKVEDGVIVFPQEAAGGRAKVQGTVEILAMERDDYIAWRRHLAEDAGKEFDASDVGPGPQRLVRLRGQGAEVRLP